MSWLIGVILFNLVGTLAVGLYFEARPISMARGRNAGGKAR